MLFADDVVGVAAMPPKVTVLLPWVAPKLLPLMVTAVAAGPLEGERLVSVGGTVKVGRGACRGRAPTVAAAVPLGAPAGAGDGVVFAGPVVGGGAEPPKGT